MNSPFPAPIDLSNLPGYNRLKSVRTGLTAFIGRCSTKDRQDPASSIAGQLAVCTQRLELGDSFDRHYWDVESGYLELGERSQHRDEYYSELNVPVPRDGGLSELLEEAERGVVTRVIGERSDRAARNMLASLTVESCLARWGVELLYATEPPEDESAPGFMTANRLRLRRGQQVDAEVYKHQMLEWSTRGQWMHTKMGYSHGSAPYPYITKIDPTAPPRDTRFTQRPKRRLQPHPDPRRWETVTLMGRLRLECTEYRDIATTLNARPDQYPHDVPGKTWTAQRVRALLLNPRLTGYAVFNRRSNKRGYIPVPISEWVWSERPSHTALWTVVDWANMMKMDSGAEIRVNPLDRVRAAARAAGGTVNVVRSKDSHVTYEVAGAQYTVPRGRFPETAADRIINQLNAQT